MFCSNCGKSLPDNAEFCANCGVALNSEVSSAENTSKSNQDGFDASDESLNYLITKILNSGVASIKYWSIAFTDKAVYFCDMGNNYLPLGLGAIEDLRLGRKLNKNNANIRDVLDKSKKYYRIDKHSIPNIEIQKGLFTDKIILHNVEGGQVSIKIKGKQLKEFSNQIQKSNN